ncbi:MAG: 30S ribosomal protein S17 [Candidatus Woesearchaeota archaeon]
MNYGEQVGEPALSVRGQQLVGTVISAKAQKTATIIMERQVKIKKYNRYIKKRSKVQVHNTVEAQEGDVVRVMATRPLSKTKHHVIVEILKKAGEQSNAQVGNVTTDIDHIKEAKEEREQSEEKTKKSE